MEILPDSDLVVIGGGVIGMAVARALALRGREVILLEAESSFGSQTSSRNSEVIHAGIYYPQGSMKASLCIAGKRALYDYCRARGITHRSVGKLIVATTESQLEELQRLKAQACANGVDDLEWLSARDVSNLEAKVTARAALLSPSTGIIDSHQLVTNLRYDAQAAGAFSVTRSPVLGGRVTDRGFLLKVGGVEPMELACRAVVNAAGLSAQQLARSFEGFPNAFVPPTYFAKGHYFMFAGTPPFRRLVYPIPEAGGLGIHVTLDLTGAVRFGPDVCWVDSADYAFDAGRAPDFYRAIRKYYPELPDGALRPGYTGIRPRLTPPGGAPADFLVQGPEVHGLPLVNLFGIESPGLTASLALAEHVCDLLPD